jgi:hypothetical protein
MKHSLFLVAALVTLMVTIADGQVPQGGRPGGGGPCHPAVVRAARDADQA